MTMDRRLPDFIIIGAMKSATTSLYYHLRHHPGVAVAKMKEPDFFARRGDDAAASLEWYRRLFPDDDRTKGEASTGYTKHPVKSGAPARIHALLPHVKLIYLVRDPIDRLLSHYRHQLIDRNDDRPLADVVIDPRKRHLIDCSRYFYQLQQYLPYFPREQLRVIVAERLTTQPAAVMREVFEFIGVDPSFTPDSLFVRYNEGDRRRQRPWFTKRIFENRLLGRVDYRLRSMLPERVYNLTSFVTGQKVPALTVTPDIVDLLRRELSDDVAQLKAFTGLTFSEWKHDYTTERETDAGTHAHVSSAR